ncbi:thiamine phosphate synthase [uncultured Ruminococcus sp.]|uniref:thiamine phosphate synthase n=1 Tax=uncultured Ruminococcus sp. TaxID=165186 RepID=UPI002618445F|nr:thiamine phosphate synthase [uncultured Ruminococcus sp.]
MSDIICVTNRSLCREDFLLRMEKIAAAGPAAMILREKDLSPDEYGRLAEKVMNICGRYGVECILHNLAETAASLGAERIHLPLHRLTGLPDELRETFSVIGASCHSVSDALAAKQLGASYITAGHVFATDCKKGLAPRGLDFLRDVCGSAGMPVYAIGGISPENAASVREAGAAGMCVMSGLMTCDDPALYIKQFGGNI